jgi:GNAT superfamily N-acetyltransferase
MSRDGNHLRVRRTRPEDFDAIIEICRRVYPDVRPWEPDQLASHLAVFPEGQFAAVGEDADGGGERVLGMAASLVISWDDYEVDANWRDFTDRGYFTNHDPAGRTLYGAEVMVDPALQGRGVGSLLYVAREELVRRLGLKRIRAGARLRGYHRYADRLTTDEYVERVVAGEIGDPTLSFQLHRGFEVLAVVEDYLHADPSSQGHAALIEWVNPEAISTAELAARAVRYRRG